MKTLADRSVLHPTVERLLTVLPERLPRWGVMTADRMIEHLVDAFRMAACELPVQPCLLPLAPVARVVILRGGISLPKNVQTIPELDLRHMPGFQQSFLLNRKRLVERVYAFTGLVPEALLPAHPMLGTMSHWEWMRWGYLHTDHHLRQFGC